MKDALQEDILILDEPESSFDNIFLKDGVDSLLKELSEHIPVVIATHNNTIGASVHPDFLIFIVKGSKCIIRFKHRVKLLSPIKRPWSCNDVERMDAFLFNNTFLLNTFSNRNEFFYFSPIQQNSVKVNLRNNCICRPTAQRRFYITDNIIHIFHGAC